MSREDVGCIYWISGALHDAFRCGPGALSDRQILSVVKAAWIMLDRDTEERCARSTL